MARAEISARRERLKLLRHEQQLALEESRIRELQLIQMLERYLLFAQLEKSICSPMLQICSKFSVLIYCGAGKGLLKRKGRLNDREHWRRRKQRPES